MGYYMGDFYGRRFHHRMARGDPGFFSFVGKALGTIGSFIPGVGPVVSKVGGALARVGAKHPALVAAGERGVAAIVKHPAISAAGGAAAIATGVALTHHRGAAAGMGGMGMGGMAGGARRHRRMHVTNVKALRRALRRAQGFAKLAMRTIHLIHPRKKVRFGGFKKRRKK